jgi:streptogramin lyase
LNQLEEWKQSKGRPRGRRREPCAELLESRLLLSTITEYPVPLVNGKNGTPAEITVGPGGSLWFIETGGNAIGSLSATNPTPTIYPGSLPSGSLPTGITLGPDGKSIWFTELAANQIGMINPNDTTHTIHNFGSSNGMAARSGPAGITSANGYVWFTQNQTHQIGRLDPSTGNITEYSAPVAMTDLDSRIVLGPDGNLWFTEIGAIGIFDPSTGTMVKEVALPSTREEPFGIAVGPDGNIWYTEAVFNSTFTGYVSFGVGVIKTNTQSVIKEIPLAVASEPFGIATGPDGNLWFAVTSAGNVAGTINRIDTATQSVTQTLSIPTNVVATPSPVGVTAGPDGNFWFTDASGAIGVVNLNVQPHFVVTTAPSGVTAGQGFGLTITAEYGSGIVDSLWNGNVSVSLASNPGGAGTTFGGTTHMVSAVQGVATFSGLTLNKAGTGFTLQASSSGTGAPASATTSGFNVVAAAATKLVVTSQPPGSVASPFGFTVAAEDQFNNVDTNFSGTVTVTLATNAGGAGTILSGRLSLIISPASATPGFVTFNGLALNIAGTGYKLGVSSNPALNPTTTNAFNVTAPITPPSPPPTIVGASVVISRKFNKKHKPIGKATVSGYTITFSTAMDQTALANSANYQFALKIIKKVKVGKNKVTRTVLQPIGFSVASLTTNSVTIKLGGQQKFPKGGQVTVIAAPPGGIDNTSHVFLDHNGILAISPKGTRITLVS